MSRYRDPLIAEAAARQRGKRWSEFDRKPPKPQAPRTLSEMRGDLSGRRAALGVSNEEGRLLLAELDRLHGGHAEGVDEQRDWLREPFPMPLTGELARALVEGIDAAPDPRAATGIRSARGHERAGRRAAARAVGSPNCQAHDLWVSADTVARHLRSWHGIEMAPTVVGRALSRLAQEGRCEKRPDNGASVYRLTVEPPDPTIGIERGGARG